MSNLICAAIRFLTAVVISLALSNFAADAATADFYQGKKVRIIVGYPPGGGYDFYARLMARYIGKYIPGNPHFIIENMPGAGSLASANYYTSWQRTTGSSWDTSAARCFRTKRWVKMKFSSIRQSSNTSAA